MWFLPLKESARQLFETYKIGMTVGDTDSAMFALVSLQYIFIMIPVYGIVSLNIYYYIVEPKLEVFVFWW